MSARPVFIPLSGEWFDRIESGEKRVEYRRVRGPWTVENVLGRDAVLSRGYGRHRRLRARIVGARIVDSTGTDAARVYGNGVPVLAMDLELEGDR